MKRYLQSLLLLPSEWHPRLATLVVLGIGTAVSASFIYSLVARYPPLPTIVFVIGLLGFGIFVVSGLAYAGAVVRDLISGQYE